MKVMAWIGYDPREAASFAVARATTRRQLGKLGDVAGLVLSHLRADGLFTRPTETRMVEGAPVLWDVISDAPCSTEHANSRFMVPYLSGGAGYDWALFHDGDMMSRPNADFAALLDGLDTEKAVYCVKHKYQPKPGLKMDGQLQTFYARKNWSSFMLINLRHPSNKKLTLEMANTIPGRDLHAFCWLEDDEIGELDPAWNWLVGHSSPDVEPKVVHWTNGPPHMPGYEDAPFAEEWRAELNRWAV